MQAFVRFVDEALPAGEDEAKDTQDEEVEVELQRVLPSGPVALEIEHSNIDAPRGEGGQEAVRGPPPRLAADLQPPAAARSPQPTPHPLRCLLRSPPCSHLVPR